MECNVCSDPTVSDEQTSFLTVITVGNFFILLIMINYCSNQLHNTFCNFNNCITVISVGNFFYC